MSESIGCCRKLGEDVGLDFRFVDARARPQLELGHQVGAQDCREELAVDDVLPLGRDEPLGLLKDLLEIFFNKAVQENFVVLREANNNFPAFKIN